MDTDPEQDGVEGRKYPDVDDDETRDLMLENKSRREVDEGNIEKKPQK